ncbi:Kinesin-like protein KIF23 [Toxocara canis]|uniref:Kinesin-like protein n=1 Tax=Toxocara canis TaxID=6265 RepID=A0A0B2V182_TOXCA|nr:Kinesin-like protein KIF23 [Toxocara canis]
MPSRKREASTPSAARRPKRIDIKEAVEVMCRICPLSSQQEEACAIALDEQHVKLIAPLSSRQHGGQTPEESIYKFTYVFDEEDSQKSVFGRCALDLVQEVIRGRNALLFTYGVSGSGKTYTMTGNTAEDSLGILPRALDVLFNSLPNVADKCIFCPDCKNGFVVLSELEASLSRRMTAVQPSGSLESLNRFVESRRVSGASTGMVYAVFVSYVEVYNDLCYDLLADPVTRNDGIRVLPSKDIRMGPKNSVYVDGVVEVEVQSSGEALEQFFRGQERRNVADTLLNKASSRSHSIFNIRLVMAPCQPGLFYPQSDPAQAIHISQLSLVDLAGSERTKRTCNEGIRLTETGKINQSLLVLRQCFDKLRANQCGTAQSVQVPYRDSKLTYLFKNFFEGSGKVRMIVCVNPRPDDYCENLSVMSFAEVSQKVFVTSGEQVQLPVGNKDSVDRRHFLQWMSEVESDETTGSFRSCECAPSFDLESSDDTHSLERLRAYFLASERTRNEKLKEWEQKDRDFELQLRRMLYKADTMCGRLQDSKRELEEANQMIIHLNSQIRQLRVGCKAGAHESFRRRSKSAHMVGTWNRALPALPPHMQRAAMRALKLSSRSTQLDNAVAGDMPITHEDVSRN